MVRLRSPQVPISQKGFSVGLIIIPVAILILGFFAFNFVSHFPKDSGKPSWKATTNCKKEFTKFNFSPLKIEDIEFIEPMGKMAGEHVTPTDHQYFRPTSWEVEPKPRDFISPGDGTITLVERLNFQSFSQTRPTTDHRLIIQHSCDVSTIYIHISEFSDRVIKAVGELQAGKQKMVNIPVAAGEVIGKIKLLPELSQAYQVDFTVIDERVTLDGFVDPSLYKDEPWKIHVAHPFDYFAQPILGQLLAKSLRTEEPAGGKIDYDIDGKLVGNWFLEGTDYVDEDNQRYWETHLTLAYDYIDPTHIQISIGNLNGKPAQFNVEGNVPDPAQVGVGNLVKYELTGFEYVQKGTSKYWDRRTFMKGLVVQNNTNVEGVMLLELLENRKLKIEVFPGKTAEQVNGFSTSAKIYVR